MTILKIWDFKPMTLAPRLVAALGALLTTTAYGQDGTEVAMARTPANAQRFLTMLDGVQAGLTANFSAGSVKFTSTDACQTQVTFGNKKRFDSNTTNWSPEPGDTRMTMDWSKADQASLQTVDTIVTIQLKSVIDDRTPRVNLYFTSDHMRERAWAAMHYLQEACDKAKETGF